MNTKKILQCGCIVWIEGNTFHVIPCSDDCERAVNEKGKELKIPVHTTFDREGVAS